MNNIMTVDVEDWYQTLDFKINSSNWNKYEDRVENNTDIILDLFAKYNIKATFFILGFIGIKFPNLVKKIFHHGHNIGSHGLMHKLAYTQKLDEFRKDIRESKYILENIIGSQVKSFRSSSWSIDKRNLWALEEIQSAGYLYDSSIQPFKTYLSGMKNAPHIPFNPIINNNKLKIIEFPVSVFKLFNTQIPFSGGLYYRISPYSFTKFLIHKINKTKPVMLYFHPWEFDLNQPKLPVSFITKITHYYNITNNNTKLEKTLKDFNFISLEEYAENLKVSTISL